MTVGTIHHLALTVKDLDKSEPFYHAILTFMGYQQIEKSDQLVIDFFSALIESLL